MEWVPSPHYGSRKGHAVRGVVIHVMEGTMEGTDQWFRDKGSKVSAHYGISKTGEVHQYVEDQHAAWHAGRVDSPTTVLVEQYPGVNPNLYTIGIEHEGLGRSDFTEDQYRESARLIGDLAKRHRFAISRDTVVPHSAIYSKKSCPGPVDINRLIFLAQEQFVLRPVLGEQRWSDYFNSNITLVGYMGNAHWYFTVNKDPLQHGIRRAAITWTSMPPSR